MKCLAGNDRAEADLLLDAIAEEGRLEYLCSSEERDFIINCQKSRHIHWPVEWLQRLRDIADILDVA